MEKLTKILETLLSAVTAIALLGMMLHTVVHALMRSLFESPLYGTNELVAYWYLPVVTLLGFLAAHMRKEHISVSLVFDRLKRKNQLEYIIVSSALAFVLFVGFAWFGFTEAMGDFQTGATAGVTFIVVWPVKLLVPFVFILLAVLFSIDIAKAVQEIRSSGVGVEHDTDSHADNKDNANDMIL